MIISDIELKFDAPCWSCTNGATVMPDDSGVCMICDGTGRMTTEAGDELIEFIVRHWAQIKKKAEGGRS